MNSIEVLGLKIEMVNCQYENQLPVYLSHMYTIKKVLIHDVYAIMLSPNVELPTISALKKHMLKIQSIEDLPVFLKLEKLSEYRKNHFLSNQIPFVYLEKLVYLPFLGTVLTDVNLKQTQIVEKFTASAQLLFIWIMHQNTDKFYISDAISKLKFSNMTLTRAYRQLVNSGLFSEAKDGRKIYLTTTYNKKELFQKAKSYLTSPVIRLGYIDEKNLSEKNKVGESLLSELTSLNPPKVSEYAIFHEKIDKSLLTTELIDSKVQVKLELWSHDPLIFSKDHKTIDIISLAISLLKSEDERVEIEIEHLLENL